MFNSNGHGEDLAKRYRMDRVAWDALGIVVLEKWVRIGLSVAISPKFGLSPWSRCIVFLRLGT